MVARKKPLRVEKKNVDLWQIMDKLIKDWQTPRPQDKEFYGTIRKVLRRGNVGLVAKDTEEEKRFKNNWTTDQGKWPIYALVEVPFLTVRNRTQPPRDWESNFLKVDITKMEQAAEGCCKNRKIVFTFDEDFNYPTFTKYPTIKDHPDFELMEGDQPATPSPVAKNREGEASTSQPTATKAPPRAAGAAPAQAPASEGGSKK